MLTLPLSLMATVVPEWRLHSSTSTTHATHAVVTETYYSQPISLKAGHMIFTKPQDTPLKMPSGKYAITSFFGDIVDDSHASVPLSTVYDHHWIAVSSKHRNQLCNGGLEYVFGIGAESRNNPVNFPAGYGYVVEAGTWWGANIHLLRTEGLAGDNAHRAAKECNECYYAPTKGSQCTVARNGTFQCCGDNDYEGVSSCPTASGPLPPERNYYLRYRLSYTRDLSAITPLDVGVIATPDCQTFYDVYRNDDDKVDTKAYELTIPTDVEVPFAVGHMHTGALNVSLSVNGKVVCTSLPTYGTEEGVAGNEKGYLVKVSHCIDETTGPLQLKRGVTVTAHYFVGSYDSRLLYSDGTHLNVMGYMYVAYRQTGSEAADVEWQSLGAGGGSWVEADAEKKVGPVQSAMLSAEVEQVQVATPSAEM